MNALETVRKWLEAFPQSGVLSGFQVDYTDKIPGTGGIMPDGLVEVRRSRDIVGDTTITNRYNFGLYCVLEKAPNDDVGATKNADWIVDLQEWLQEQSATGAAPVFGDDPRAERITAQNGTLLQARISQNKVVVTMPEAPLFLNRVTMRPAGPTANTVPTMISSTTLNTRMTFFMKPPR